MSEKDKNTEELIFEAAKEVFIEKGFNGTRMEEISKKAGINKALLHYYFRTKEKLFAAIFAKVFSEAIPYILKMMESDAPLFEKIEFFVDKYITLISRNPHIPMFLLNELNRNPQHVAQLIGNATGIIKNNAFEKIDIMLKKEIENGTIEPIKAEHFMVNMISLCIFPFVARPILQGVIFKGDERKYKLFLEERKTEVVSFIINSIRKR